VPITVDPLPDQSAAPDPLDVDVERNRSAACWSVQEGDWSAILPAEIAALLAPPVVVSAQSVAPSGRLPGVRDNSRPAGYVPVADESRTPRFLTPAPPLRRRNRRAGRAG
jgi:hypothetical protein